MDPQAIDAVSKVGFPIVAAIGVATFLALVGRWAMRQGERLIGHVIESDQRMEERLNSLQPQLDRIETKTGCRAPHPPGPPGPEEIPAPAIAGKIPGSRPAHA